MTVTPSRSPLGAFVRSPLGVRGGGGVELYFNGYVGGIASVGSKIWQAMGNTDIGTSLPVNFSKGGSVWNRGILKVKSPAGESYKRWERSPICYGTDGSYCVAAKNTDGEGSIEIFHSTDFKTWTRMYYLSTITNLVCFAWSPLASKFVALCSDDYAITSPDGINWTRTLSDIVGSTSIMAKCFWNPATGYFYQPTYSIAFGVVVNKQRSSNGVNWSDYEISPPFPTIISAGDADVGINPYVYTGTVFGTPQYALQLSPNIYTATDGLNWTASYTASANLSFCCSGGGILVAGHSTFAGSDSTTIYYSSDSGTTWNSTTITSFYTIEASTTAAYSCTYSNGKFYLSGLGNGTTVYTSIDGATWKKLEPTKLDYGGDLSTFP